MICMSDIRLRRCVRSTHRYNVAVFEFDWEDVVVGALVLELASVMVVLGFLVDILVDDEQGSGWKTTTTTTTTVSNSNRDVLRNDLIDFVAVSEV